MTNLFGIPDLFVKASEKNEERHEFNPKRFSVTELLSPTYLIQLSRKYQTEEDIRDKVIALLGTAFHSYMEQFSTNPEVEMSYELDNGYIVSGIIDDLDENNHTICDYKTSNVNKVKLGDFSDYEKQIKCYAWLCHKKGILITHGRVYVLMKDWKKIMLTKDDAYPPTPIYVHDFNITSDDINEIDNYIKNKINDVLNGSEMCNDEERWYSGTTYATYKNENDARAVKIYKDKDEADATGLIVKERKGEYLRCDLYCKEREHCGRYN